MVGFVTKKSLIIFFETNISGVSYGMPNLEIAAETPNWQVWHTTGEKCPPRTIPIRRTTDISHSKYPKPFYKSLADATRGHRVFF